MFALQIAPTSSFAKPDLSRYAFSIEADSLGQALDEFVELTGAQLMFSHNLASATDINPVVGYYSIEKALDVLLKNTRFSGGLTKGGMIVVSLKTDRRLRKMIKNKRLFTGLSVLLATQSYAQEPEPMNYTSLEEIVVTAERRAADVQDIPISMTALNGDLLEKKAVTRLEDLQFASPGLSVVDGGVTQSVNIRGIGLTSEDPDVTNGVATYVDGLFQQPIVSKASFYDIDNVQVMRGPQGTFAGAASTGGAIFINSKRANVGDEFNGYIEAGAGNYGATNFQGAVTFPVSDTLAVRAALNKRERDTFYNSIGTVPTTAGDLDEFSGRLGVTWAPTDALEVYAKYQTLERRNGGLAVAPIPTTTFAAARPNDIRDLAYNAPSKNDEDAETYLIDLRYTLDNDITIKLVSGEVTKEFDNLVDIDATLLASLEQDFAAQNKQTSHEINIISRAGEKLEWIVGYYDEENTALVDQKNTGGVDIINNTQKKISGLFGQVGYYLRNDLQVEFGLRKAWFESFVFPESGVFFNGTKVFVLGGQHDETDLLGKLSVNWTYDDSSLLYALIAKGYKPGGTNSPISNFEKEQLWSFEAGWKSTMLDGRLRTSLAVFYNDYTDFQNNAVDLATGRSDIANIAEATIQGVEFSVDGQFGNLRLDAGFSYVDSNLEPTQSLVNTRVLPGSNLGPQCPNGVPSNPPVCYDYTSALLDSSSGPNLFAPELSMTLGIEYDFEVFDSLTLTPRINYAWIDEQWTNIVYSRQTDLLESRGLLSAGVTLEGDGWSARLYGRNLTDEEYVTGQAIRESWEFYGAPREYGLDFTFNF